MQESRRFKSRRLAVSRPLCSLPGRHDARDARDRAFAGATYDDDEAAAAAAAAATLSSHLGSYCAGHGGVRVGSTFQVPGTRLFAVQQVSSNRACLACCALLHRAERNMCDDARSAQGTTARACHRWLAAMGHCNLRRGAPRTVLAVPEITHSGRTYSAYAVAGYRQVYMV